MNPLLNKKTQKYIPEALTPTPLEMLISPSFSLLGIEVYIKRDELNHAEIQGNKWHKLKHNLQQAIFQNKKQLITFGGAHSNHIAATAAAAKYYGFESLGFIRGDELENNPSRWSQTLQSAHHKGMALRFLTREAYRQKMQSDFLEELSQNYPEAWIIPEGGTNEFAISGLESLALEIQQQCPDWTHLMTAVGTGGTLAGLVRHLKPTANQQVLGVAAIGDSNYLKEAINQWINPEKNPDLELQLEKRWAFLSLKKPIRYGKITPEILATQQQFKTDFNIELDPIYTSKMVLGFYEALENKHFPRHSKIILLHTGGLQGCQTGL